MTLTVKNKIWLGTLFLFLLLLLTGGVAIFYMAKLKANAENVLRDNYESLLYCHTMQVQMNNLSQNYSASVKELEKAMRQELNDITEPGEKEAASKLNNALQKLKSGDTSQLNVQTIYQEIQDILFVNMQAIKRKSERAATSAKDALTIIISMGGLVFIVAFTFIVNFPSVITNPINQLIDAIKEISNKNYKHRIHIDNKDEFGKLADAFNNMAERLEHFESSNLNQLMFEKSRAEAVINSLKDASIGIDKNDRVLFANAQALQLLGLQAGQIVGRPVEEVKKKNDLFSFLMNNNPTTPFTIVVDNRENYFSKEAIEVEQADVKSKVIVLRNITSFKELDVAKTNFIATVSHELKTPLAASDLSLKLLEDERVSKLSGEQKELIDNLKNDNQRMLKILSELLNMSQVEAGRIELNITDVQPEIIVQNAILAVAVNAKEKNIEIKNTIQSSPPSLKADADKTTWILTNLLTNAIKYSSENSIIEVNVQQENDRLTFSVTDHGRGIEKQYLQRLFDRYFQVPGMNKKGTGLGLSISKDFAEAQGGQIRVESELGKGSTFTLLIPCG